MSHSPATPSEWEPTEPLPSDEAPQAGTPTPQERTVAFDPHADATAVFDPTQDETAVLPPMGGDTAALEAGPEPTRVIDPRSADTFAAPDGGASVVTDPAEREPDVAPARTRRTPLIIAAAVLAAILLIAGVVYSLYLHGDFDISSYVMRRARSNAPKQTFEAYKANQKERREASFNYPLFLGAVYMAAALFIAYVFY